MNFLADENKQNPQTHLEGSDVDITSFNYYPAEKICERGNVFGLFFWYKGFNFPLKISDIIIQKELINKIRRELFWISNNVTKICLFRGLI